jgi:hypothetical protein
MTKDELRALAARGVKDRLAEIERELARMHAEFPEAFASATAPIVLAAEARPSGNGWKAEHVETVRDAVAEGHKRAWTPARRAKYSRMMKKRIRDEGHPAKGNRRAKPPRGPARDWKNQWYTRLETHGPEGVAVSARALGTSSANLLTASKGWIKAGVIVKQGKKGGPGPYAVGAARPDVT